MFCKTIILSNSQNLSNNAPKGILTLSKENLTTLGKIRLYNLEHLPQGVKVGLYINEKVFIYPLSKKPNHYEFELDNSVDITQGIYCALIDTFNNKQVILEGGSFSGFCFTDSPFDAVIEAKDTDLEQTISNALDEVEDCPNCNCANCEYKKYFYQNYSNQDNSPALNTNQDTLPNLDANVKPVLENIEILDNQQTLDSSNNQIEVSQQNVINTLVDEVNNGIEQLSNTLFDKSNDNLTQPNQTPPPNNEKHESNKLDFLNEIVEQLDIMFEQNPPDDMLNSIIPNSRFVKVVTESPYVLGVIYEDQMLKYIAYGVPGKYNDLPPIDLGQHYQWLPLNPRDVMSDGYFMIYQDALTGSLVEINFE